MPMRVATCWGDTCSSVVFVRALLVVSSAVKKRIVKDLAGFIRLNRDRALPAFPPAIQAHLIGDRMVEPKLKVDRPRAVTYGGNTSPVIKERDERQSRLAGHEVRFSCEQTIGADRLADRSGHSQ